MLQCTSLTLPALFRTRKQIHDLMIETARNILNILLQNYGLFIAAALQIHREIYSINLGFN